MLTIDVGSPGGEWGYPIHVGHGILPQLGRRCKELGLGPRGAVVADAALGSRVDAVVEILREAGFDNVNLDFMFGLPGQTLGEWRDTVEKACELRPEHLSLIVAKNNAYVRAIPLLIYHNVFRE